ncbi:MAG TPA: exosortase F system-associated protein [Flavobacterium sp.]|nr:exosortase F system-associated protein [Flavobacterium sp.]
MLKKLLNHKIRIALAILFIIFLALIRAYEDNLFYDPFLVYFKSDYNNLPIPEINNLKLFLDLAFRFFLNTVISLAIIYALFKDIDAIKFASFLYIIFFSTLIAAFFYVLLNNEEPNKMGLFYIRRFLIQPLFLLLFIPAFYYQKQKN